jgi:hypothetical protein
MDFSSMEPLETQELPLLNMRLQREIAVEAFSKFEQPESRNMFAHPAKASFNSSWSTA